jgi:eukaryotic-like serine/threonine-protein kinase
MVDPNRAKSVFLAAVDKPPAERAAFLDEAVGDDATLRKRVEALIQAHEDPDSFLDKAGAQLPTVAHSPPAPLAEHVGTLIGPYKLLEQIGEGGMGVVFMAQQTAPVARKVALKIIKLGMDSRQVIARFEAERQALALMDHPNIARMLDAGTTENGRPYFAMELVKGLPIIQYCDEHRLTPRQRLELFVSVCQAVQHAHQKGIIHRDLKPTNVLVADYDDKPVAKIIDFGVAKAVGQPLTEKTMFTQFGQVIGTFEYMSPEQAKLNQLDIDTRTDIYSLGVLLYELLTGSTPLEPKQLRSAAFDEMLRRIREDESPKPSTRLSTTDGLPSIAANRSLEPSKLMGLVRGELDWIVMKALEKDRNRRYETANGMARDIEHYLCDEPVQACPPSRTYRLKKFVRRNRTTVAVAASFAGILMATALVSCVLALNALRAKDRAIRAETVALDNIYAADMGLAKEALDQFDVTRARDLLNKHVPTPGETDRRGLEWRYLAALARGEWTAIIPTSLEGGVSAIGITPDDRFIVAAGAKGQLCVIRFENFKTVFSTRAFASGDCSAIDVAADGRTIAVSGDATNQSVGLWRLNDEGELSLIRRLHAESPYAIAISPDTKTLAVGTQTDFWSGDLSLGGITKLFDIASGKELATLPESGGRAVAFSPDGKRLATGHWHGQNVKLWDPATRKLVQTLEIRTPCTLEFSADSKLLLIGTMSRELRLADLGMPAGTPMQDETFTRTGALAHNYGYIRQAAMSDDQRWAAMCCENAIYLGDRLAHNSRQLIGHESHAARCLAFSHRSDFLVSGDRAGTLMLWNVAGTDNRHTRLQQSDAAGNRSLPEPPSSPDGRKIAFRTRNHETMIWDEVKVVDTAIGEVRPVLHTPAWPLAFIDDNTLLTIRGLDFLETFSRLKPVWSTTNANPVLEFWDLVSLTNRQLVLEAVAKRDVSAIAISHDCRLIALAWRQGDTTNGVILLALPTGDLEWSVSEIRSRINGIAFSPDGQSLAVACMDGKVQILRVNSGAKGPEMLGQGVAETPAFSPDGEMMAVACWDGIRLFSMPDGKSISLLNGNAHRVTFSADGKTLVAHGGAGGPSENWWHLPTGRQLFSTSSPWAIVPESMIVLNGEILVASHFSGREGLPDERDVFQLPPLDNSERWRLSQPSSLTEARRLAHRFPDLAETWAGRGDSFRKMNEFAKMSEDYSEAIKLKPDTQWYWHERAYAYLRLGEHKKAIADLTKAIELGDQDAGQRLRRGYSYQALGDLQHAKGDDSKAIELEPKNWRGWHARAQVYAKLGESDKARADLENAVKFCSNNAGEQNELAWELAADPGSRLHNPKAAVELAEKAVAAEPRAGEIWNTLGVAQYRAGNWQRAVTALNKSVELRQGGDSSDWFFLAMGHSQLNHKDEARTWYDKAVAWMDKNAPKSEELLRFRREAEELLNGKPAVDGKTAKPD